MFLGILCGRQKKRVIVLWKEKDTQFSECFTIAFWVTPIYCSSNCILIRLPSIHLSLTLNSRLSLLKNYFFKTLPYSIILPLPCFTVCSYRSCFPRRPNHSVDISSRGLVNQILSIFDHLKKKYIYLTAKSEGHQSFWHITIHTPVHLEQTSPHFQP